MTNRMNYDKPLPVKHLINDTIVADTKFVESCKVARHCLKVNRVEICSQPIDTPNDAPSDWLVYACQLTGRSVQNADAIHAAQSRPSRRAAFESDSPRRPDATAFLWRISLSRRDCLISCPSSGSPSNSSNFRSTVVSMISLSSSFVIRDTVGAIFVLLMITLATRPPYTTQRSGSPASPKSAAPSSPESRSFTTPLS